MYARKDFSPTASARPIAERDPYVPAFGHARHSTLRPVALARVPLTRTSVVPIKVAGKYVSCGGVRWLGAGPRWRLSRQRASRMR